MKFQNLSQRPVLADSPMTVSPCDEDSPFSLFKVRKKKVTVKSRISCDYSASGSIVTTPTNKRYANKEKEVIKVCLFSL